MDYKKIKEIAATDKKLTVSMLLAMSEGRDPFYVEIPNRIQKGKWFEKIWRKYAKPGYHLRRLHYKIIGQVKKPDGKKYQNIRKDWELLGNAAVNARYLGLIPYGEFVDKRNPPPRVLTQPDNSSLYSVGINESAAELTSIYPRTWGSCNKFELRNYYIEIWAEKSTYDDILIPLCEKYNITLITGAGFESVTHENDLYSRIKNYYKGCRIFYISDYDPAGHNMPRQVSRHLQFRIEKDQAQDTLNVRLKPILLLKEHIKQYDLPTFLGRKQTEVDALEALHPGEFEKIVKSYLDKYIDLDVEAKCKNDEINEEVKFDIKLEEIIDDEYGDKIEKIKEEIEDLRQEINDFVEDEEFNSTNLGMPNPKSVIERDDDWLFISELDYFNQLKKFKQYESDQKP